MQKLEAQPIICYVPAGLRLGTRVDVTISYRIGDVCTDSLHLGQTVLKKNEWVRVVGLPNKRKGRPTTYELSSEECEEWRRLGSQDRAEEEKGVVDRKFIRTYPELFAFARRVTARRALKQPMLLGDITNVRLEVY